MPSLGALYLDIENVYWHLVNDRQFEPDDAGEALLSVVRKTREHFVDTFDTECIVENAYADFDRIEASIQGPLFLAGIETKNVLSTDHKNAADMRLCIDAMEVLYTRKEIECFVFVAGDRDYIPVIRHLKQMAKRVFVVAFNEALSGDLRQVVPDDRIIDIDQLGLDLSVSKSSASERQLEEKPADRVAVASEIASTKQVRSKSDVPVESANERRALDVLLTNFSRHKEIWMTPFIKTLREELPLLAEYERKAIIGSLQTCGAISVEYREGIHPHSGEYVRYAVILVNWDHPTVRELNPG